MRIPSAWAERPISLDGRSLFDTDKISVDCTSRTKRLTQKRYRCCRACEPVGWAYPMKRTNINLKRHSHLHPQKQPPVKYFEDCYMRNPPSIVNTIYLTFDKETRILTITFDQPITSQARIDFNVKILEQIKVKAGDISFIQKIPNGYSYVFVTVRGYGISCGRISKRLYI